MKHSNSSLFRGIATAGFIALAIFLACPVYGQDESAALMLEISPSEGGSVNFSEGVHVFDRDSEVRLTATPKAGFQFVCWLGNVASARNSSTSVFLDSPKIIIAVFERSKFSFVEREEAPDISSGQGGLIRSPREFGSRLSGDGGRRPPSFSFPRGSTDVPVPEENEGNPPVPGSDEDPPVPVPEPATVAFLLAGIFAVAKRSHRRNKVQQTAII